MTVTTDSDRNTYLINWRTSVWVSMREKEANCWRFIAVYVPAVLAILGIGFERFPLRVLVLVCLAATSWGILTVVDANFWFNRNLKIVSNIERMIAPYVYDKRIIPPYYGRPSFQYFMTYRTMIRLFSIVVLAVLLWATYANKSPDGQQQYQTWALIYIGEVALCIWVFVEDYMRRNNYAKFSSDATGPGNTDDSLRRHKEQRKAVHKFNTQGPIAHLLTSNLQMVAIIVFIELGFPEIKATCWHKVFLGWPFALLFLCPLVSLRTKFENARVRWFVEKLFALLRLIVVLMLTIIAAIIGFAILIFAAFNH